MALPQNVESIVETLPDPESAHRFYLDLSANFPQITKISEPLLSDLLTLSAYSPLLATTLLQNTDYIQWLGRERSDTKVRSKEELLDSLSRFSLLHATMTPNVILARFRRRELLRIYLRDIRRLATIAEITEELSNLADAIIEFALRVAKQDLENRYGVPLHTDDRGRSSPADFCVIALGKLGSLELNYSSDIDLLFIYSSEGKTSETGSNDSVSNREYFIKLSEKVIALAGGQSGEGAAYRIDMRLRPHGSIGRLAVSLEETVHYYKTEAREWEQQVLIRSRAVAGEFSIFKQFYSNVEDFIFRPDTDVDRCLANVRRSKRQIEDLVPPGSGYNVKLGRGGIREIEFIAQALQLAYGGRDKWLRSPHTLISLSRLADRSLLTDKQLNALFDAYQFLRHVEHLLQMEHGLQTHSIPKNDHQLLARRAGFLSTREFDTELDRHSNNVQQVFAAVFSEDRNWSAPSAIQPDIDPSSYSSRIAKQTEYGKVAAISPHFAQLFASVPEPPEGPMGGYLRTFIDAIAGESDFAKRLSLLRRTWSRSLLGIVLAELEDELSMSDSKRFQTELAEASIEAALNIMLYEIRRRNAISDLELSVLALGKLGGRGIDFGSDLDIVLVYPDNTSGEGRADSELYHRAVEIFVTTLSGMTRDGNLYRVDLRLRPYGKNGASANPRSVFVDYFKKVAAVWELLAFVKLRAVNGAIADEVETEVREIIHHRARETAGAELRSETIRIRQLLEREKAGRESASDIKYGPGGLLDVYFAARYLQLRDNVRDGVDDRSTRAALTMLWEAGSISADDLESLSVGYAFLSELDHNIRLTTGRSRYLPSRNAARNIIARRMNFTGPDDLMGSLALHRIRIRKAFENILSG